MVKIKGNKAGSDREAVKKLFDDTRRRLVETGTRNRLVHVNRASSRGNILNIVNERSEDVYSILCSGKTMRFRPIGRDREAKADAPRLKTAGNEEVDPERYVDAQMETPLGPEALIARLLKIAREAQTAEEEQGVNILYLALGFLKWFEDKSSAIPREAPLVLLPVELVRNKRTSTYDLRLRDEDMVSNLPLRQRLKDDFGIKLPEVEVEEGWTPSAYFDQVQEIVNERPGWSISRDAMQLGFFSFAKLLMFLDLDMDAWPDGALEAHPLTRGLLYEGFDGEPPPFGSEDRLDEVLPPSKLFHVVDADASQARAIEEVRAGRSLVIQGPPGTGKSQTITNILATAVREGKTVLFVAEKMAALSVVHDRLVKVGLRDVCLELHSKGANKKAVLAELARTLGAAQAVPDLPAAPIALTAARDRLNAISSALHAPVGDTGETGFSSLARQVRYLGARVLPPSFKSDQLATMTRDDEDRLCVAVEQYAQLLRANHTLATQSLDRIKRFDLQPVAVTRAAGALAKAAHLADSLSSSIEAACSALTLDMQPTPAQADLLLDLLERLQSMPAAASPMAVTIFAVREKGRLVEALQCGLAWRSARESVLTTFVDTACTASVSSLRGSLVRGASFFARFGPAYRQASLTLAGYLREALPKTAAERVALVDQLVKLQRLRARLAEDEAFCTKCMGEIWDGERTAFREAHQVAQWVKRISESRLAIPPAAAVSIGKQPAQLAALADAIRNAAPEVRNALSEASEMLALDPQAFGATSMENIDLRAVGCQLKAMAAALEHYRDWARMQKLRERLCADGLVELVERMDAGILDPGSATSELRFARAEQLWQQAIADNPVLTEIDGVDRHDLVAQFARLERENLQNNVVAIRARHLAQVPQGAQGEMKVIRGEIGKRRGHIALRKLFQHAPNAIQRMKPVLLMSPISIAQFLPPGKLSFDLLVIDEASQVRPEDALGAVARAKQIVVVGDQKQLPPTSFFDRLLEDDENPLDMEEEDAAAQGLLGGAATLDKLESILTLCEARGLAQRMLQWHYRSRVPSLIQVSNSEFYQDELILPPSPLQHDPKYGLCFTRVDGVYDRGGKRDNRLEGEEVVRRVAEHARTQPAITLGIVTFSAAQRNLITELLELARRTDEYLDDFLHEGRSESVFVKNIENVQGDERDVILISVCYGPSVPGGPLTSMSFGPINGEGGERRLNVLFTRARLRCEIFASFDPGAIDPGRALRDGPRILKRFLDYAQTGKLHQPAPTGGEAESPFEEEVASVISGLGYLADPQVGSAGFRIDLGIRHPDKPGRYILAVECDGATYHNALWARERDRLRQDVLEHLGWRFYRVWSTDWFYNRSVEIERLRKALQSAHEADEPAAQISGGNGAQHLELPLFPEKPEFAIPETVERIMPAYIRSIFPVHTSVEPHEADKELLAQLAIEIVEAEGPVHEEEVARRIAASFGRERAGSRIVAVAQEALKRAQRSSPSILSHDRFWFTSTQRSLPPVRDRSAEEGPTLKAANISMLEIEAALAIAREDNAGGADADLIRAAAKLLGFRRVGSDLQARITQGLSRSPLGC